MPPLARARSLRSKRKRVQGACTLSLPNFRMPSDSRMAFKRLSHPDLGLLRRLLHCGSSFRMKATRLLPVVESPAVLRHVLGSFRKECSWTHRQSLQYAICCWWLSR